MQTQTSCTDLLLQASLAALALDNNDIRDEGAKAMLQAVQTNQGLVLLRLDNTNSSADVSAVCVMFHACAA